MEIENAFIMIVGEGLIADVFKNIDHTKYLIFASGVSNSLEVEQSQFYREKNLLLFHLSKLENKTIVYFNSLICLSGINTPYYNHKREMVSLIIDSTDNYKIYNLPQIFGSKGNENNLVNYLIKCLKSNKKILIQRNTYRSIIDVDDLKNIVINTLDLPQKQFNISHIELLTAKQLVKILSSVYNIDAIYEEIDEGTSVPTENDKVIDDFITLNIDTNNYTQKLIKKYHVK